jgi:uncharacterized protein involved in exopolysaccharide biosynthesis
VPVTDVSTLRSVRQPVTGRAEESEREPLLEPEEQPRRAPVPLTFARWLAGTVERWRMVVWTAVVALAISVAAMVFIAPKYRTKASFVTNGPAQVKLPGALGGGALSGVASQLGLPGAGDASESPGFYAELIRSRELRTRLLQSRFEDPRTAAEGDSATLLDIMDIRKTDRQRALEIGIKRLDKTVRPNVDNKTNLVVVTVDAKWPDLSAAIANRTVDYVNGFNLEQRQSRGRAKRIFTEGRLKTAQGDLDAAEERLRAFYEKNREWRSAPMLTFEEARLRRRIDASSDLYMTLRREFETARISEANDAPVITRVDSAVPPRKKQWPQPVLVLPTVAFVGCLLGVLVAAAATLLADWAARHPEEASVLRAAFGGMRRDLMPVGGRARRAKLSESSSYLS